MVYAAVLACITLNVESKVYGLSHLALLEQRGIALGRYLYYLVLGGMQLKLILTGLAVRTYGERMTGYVNAGSILIHKAKRHTVGGALDSLVVLLAYEPRCVVTLQLHHNLYRVTQIVPGERITQRLGTLNVTTCYAATQYHGGRVPKIYACHVLCKVIKGSGCIGRGIGIYQESVIGKNVAILHSLDAVGTARNAQFKCPLRIRNDAIPAGITHHIAVKFERHSRNGNRSVTIIDVTAIHIIGIHVKVELPGPV